MGVRVYILLKCIIIGLAYAEDIYIDNYYLRWFYHLRNLWKMCEGQPGKNLQKKNSHFFFDLFAARQDKNFVRNRKRKNHKMKMKKKELKTKENVKWCGPSYKRLMSFRTIFEIGERETR